MSVWAEGDYPDIARTIEDVSEVVIGASGVQAGDEVLDVATGTGNCALLAARSGARVTGLDVTPELLAVGRERAAQAGVEIAFEEGDAQALSYEDERFDRVTSVFGAMFAPDHGRTAAEMLRVTRAGGTIAFSAWTPEGLNGQFFMTMGRHMPPPPPGFQPPVLWGAEDHVRALFPGAAEITCERRTAPNGVHAGSAEEWVDYLEATLGPVVLAKRALEAEGRWAPVRADLVALFEQFNEAGEEGGMHAAPEYLLTIVRKAS